MDKLFFVIGAISTGIGVALGAFGAHGLRARLAVDMLQTFETGVRYHMYHALALFVVAFALTRWQQTAGWSTAAGWLFVVGLLLFSGSLYLLAVTGVRWLGAITPLGGAAFIAGWICLVVAAIRG
jgi:uncharacterized membrane protein YgdD (TMEM256/DUF423 family)